MPFRSDVWKGFGVVGFALVLSCAALACNGGQQGSPSGSDNSAPSDGLDDANRVPRTPYPFGTPDPASIPSDAVKLPGGDFGVEVNNPGGVRGTIPVTAAVDCTPAGLMRITTQQGTFYAGVLRAGDWDCSGALKQWRQVSPSESAIGVRVDDTPGDESVMIVNESGSSMTTRVSGTWKSS